MCSPEYYTLSNFYVLVQQTQQLEASITPSISSTGARNPYHIRFFWLLLLTADRLLIVLFKHSLALPIIYQVILYQITVVIQIQTQVKITTLYSHKTYCQLKRIKSSCISFWTHTCLAHNICIIPAESSVSRIMNLALPHSILDLHHQNQSDQY